MTTLPTKLAFVDVETTGLRPHWDRVIEIGILRIEEGEIVKTINTLVNPGIYLPPEIITLTGISSENLDKSPSFRDLTDQIEEILDGCIFVAHNARFDYAFLKNEFKRYGVKYSAKQLCTAKISRSLVPDLRRFNLDKLIESFNIRCDNRHRAFDDAAVLWQLWQHFTKLDQDKFLVTVNNLLKRPSIPARLSLEIIKSLPHKSGIYIFYGENGCPLYVGKSTDIKARVLSHFNADHSSSIEMKITQTVESIDYVVTPGELGALILESETIKKLQPLYNRKLRNSYELTVLKKQQNEQGFFEVKYEKAGLVSVADLPDIIGVFRSIKQAKSTLSQLASEFNLCDKLLGLESGSSGCFGYRLGRCHGACRDKEIFQKYNLRFLEAFIKGKLRSWPFQGSIVIEEGDEDKRQIFLVDQWCLIEDGGEPQKFDLDIYKILNSYLKSTKNIKKLKNIKNNLESYQLTSLGF